MPERVRITDVSPRDGLQNEPGVIPTADKVWLVEMLGATGVDEIEVSSFVSKAWVPQLGDAAEVFAGLRPSPGPVLSALVPNERGLAGVLRVNGAAGRRLISKIAVFTAASEAFSKRNTNATIEETLERFVPVVAGAKREELSVRGYVSCAIACPIEGPVSPGRVVGVCERLLTLGVDEIDLGDTIGAGTPETIRDLLRACERSFPLVGTRPVTLHLHDTFGRAAACVRTALDAGVRSFDGAAGGLGGCPYASTPGKRAPGNISTEALVRTVHQAGFETGVDMDALAAAGAFAMEMAQRARAGA